MCGIGGIISLRGRPLDNNEINRLLYSISSRGGHAWGVGARMKTGELLVRKAPGKVPDHLCLPELDNVILHARFATCGHPRDNRNNHPHVGAGIALVHNGVVYNTHRNQKTDCDSESILKMLIDADLHRQTTPDEAMRKIKGTVEKIRGSLRLGIITSALPGIYVVSDDIDPVFWGYTPDYLYFSSEAKDLPVHSVIGRDKVNTITYVTPTRVLRQEFFRAGCTHKD